MIHLHPMDHGHAFVARCTRGIEWMVSAEIQARHLGAVDGIGHREVRFTTPELPSARALRLDTADDVLLVCGDVDGLDHTRQSLGALELAVRSIDVGRCLRLREDIVAAAGPVTMTVVASFLGRRNYNRYEIEAAVARGAARAAPLAFVDSRNVQAEQDILTLRVHLVGDRALLALRVFREPLHRRAYRSRTHAGALHPPVAAALGLMAGLHAGTKLLDPFCGAGTIPIEALRLQPNLTAVGSDIEPAKVHTSCENLQRAGLQAQMVLAHAAQLPFAGGSFDRVVSNPPWGIAVAVTGAREGSLVAGTCAEIARILRPGGRAVLLIDRNDGDDADLRAVGAAGLSLRFRSRLSLSGQHPELWALTPAGAGGTGNDAFDGQGLWGPAIVEAARLAEVLPL
jgi:tRNA (guanine6-N2)-methyltransferase